MADGLTHEFRDSAGRLYRWYEAKRQLNIYDASGRRLRSIAGVDINAAMTGPHRWGIGYRVSLPAEVGRPTGFGDYAEAVEFAEWLESVGGPKRDRGEPEAALDTIVVEMSDCLVQVPQAQHALNTAVMKGLLPDRLTGRHVVFDVTGAVDASLVAINEIVAQLYKRDAASIEFIADNKFVAETIASVLGWEDVATLLPVTLVDNSSEPEPKPEPEPEPEPDDTKPVLAYSEDGTRVELPPDTLLYGIVCQHEQRPQYCRWCRDESMGVMLKTRFGKVFVPLTNPGDPAPTASWVSGAYVQQLLAEAFEKGKA